MRKSVWVLVLALPVATVGVCGAGDWPQFRGSPSLTGVSGARLPSSPELAWTHEAGDPIESSAAVSGGRVFVGTAGGELHAVDLESGALAWRYEAQDAIGESSAAVSGGSVYIADLSGMLHAVSEADGTRRWTFQTDGEVKSSPVVLSDSVLVGSYDGYLYCISAGGGDLRWKRETDGPLHCTPGVLDGIAYVSGCDGMLRGIRVSDGEPVVTVDVGAYTGASPSLAGDRAVFGTFDNQVLAVGLKSGAVLWRYQAPERAAPFYSSAARFGGKVVVGGRDKLVHCLDADTGKALWTHATRARVDSSPAIADGRVWVGSYDGRLYSLDLETGKPLWEFRTGGRISASPAVAAGRVIVGSQDGLLYCFGAASR
ncbi:MAG: PQQ-binding-like beta-propeller repeat protein [Acidobacteriota bacterium]|nr:PQQ-binding-like beta-propeller repeat protein [Acidobacteriota bacterium]